jgi:F-box and WD-40 domain protein 1/11
MQRKNSVLTFRPRTSAVDDSATAAPALERTMKRTASQTFTSYDESREGVPLNIVSEYGVDSAVNTHSHASSLSRTSRAIDVLSGPFRSQKARRRLSSASATLRGRGGSIQNSSDALPSSSTVCPEPHRLPLQHQDSGVPQNLLPAKNFFASRLGSMRRKPAASLLPVEPTTLFPSFSGHAGLPMPGTAARQAAAAANQDRQAQLRREQEQQQQHTAMFLNGLIPTALTRNEDIKDNESGVDMTCCDLPLARADSLTEKKLGKSSHSSHLVCDCRANCSLVDPFECLPAELATAILSNLDASSVLCAAAVSPGWRHLASSTHVWRSIFLRNYEPEVHVSPAPIQMGGSGIGKSLHGQPAPGQDWMKMYAARAEINKRWKAGAPAAVYLNGHTDSVYCCQFDETKAITGSRDRTIRVWDLQTYQCLRVYGGPNHRPVSNTPPPMEERPERVVSLPSLNGTPAGNNIYTVPEDFHDASILCLQYDSKIMVTGSSDYTCIVWDITGDEYIPIRRLRGHEAGVLDVCLDDNYIISCSKDATIKVWDRETGTCIRTLRGHRGPVNAVQLRGNFLVSASGDGVAKLWNLETGVSIKDFPSEDRGLAAVEFSDDAKYVLAGGNDHVVYKFDAATGNLVHSKVKHEGLVRSLFLDAFNGRIISGSYDQSIQVSDYETGVAFATYKNWTTSWILSAKSDYRRVVATSQDGRTLILDFGYRVPGVELLNGQK